MIVTVKRNKKQKYIKFLAFLFLILMFIWYFFHMSSEFKEKQKIDESRKKAQELEIKKKLKLKKDLEKVITLETEKIVDLIGQEYVRQVRIIENKLIIICEPKTNLDALKVRYGAMALVKKTKNEIIVAVNLKYIVESRLNEK